MGLLQTLKMLRKAARKPRQLKRRVYPRYKLQIERLEDVTVKQFTCHKGES